MSCLEAGADPNNSPALPLFFLEDAGSVGATQGRWAGVTTNSKQQRIIDDQECFIAGSIACQISPLHMAMRNCFENKQLDRDEKETKIHAAKRKRQHGQLWSFSLTTRATLIGLAMSSLSTMPEGRWGILVAKRVK